MTEYSKFYSCAVMASSALSLMSHTAFAQQQNGGDSGKEIVVTGSALPTHPDDVAVPVTSISSDDIVKTGVSSDVLDILRKSVPAFAGRSTTGSSNAGNNNQRTAGGCSLELRNLDTLILVNGRRVANSAISAVNGKVFVDVCQIAPDSIDHIEVLTDGASSIYGSDAIGGVVNIILKSNYQGGQVNVRYGGASGYNERSVGFTYGFNPFRNTNITLSASYSKSDPLYQDQRRFASPFYSTGTAVPGAAAGSYYLAPGISSPALGGGYTGPASDPQYLNAGKTVNTAPGTGIGGTYDLSRFNTLLLGQEQKSVALSLNSDLSGNGDVALFGDFEYSRNNSSTRFAPITLGVTAPAGSPYNPFATATSVVFGSTANSNRYYNTAQSFRGTLGLKGKLDALGHGGNWEVAYTHSENTIDETITNIIYKANLLPAVSGGYNSAGVATAGGNYSAVTSLLTGATVYQPALDPFSRSIAVNPASLRNVLTDEYIHGRSAIDTVDGKLGGSFLHLPGGRIQYAIGASWRRDAASGAPDQTNWLHVDGSAASALQGPGGGGLTTGGLLADPFSAHRTVTAEYLEARLPLMGTAWHLPGFAKFDVIAAVRHEHYSDAGNSTVPKVGIRWEPVLHQITIRADYAQSFTAPSLYAVSGPLNYRLAGAGIVPGAIPGGIGAGFNAEDGNNPNARPAHADSYTVGIVLKPDFVPRLQIDAEFSSVKETGQVTGIGFNNILIDVNANGAASQFYNNISLGAFPGQGGASNAMFAAPGALAAYLKNGGNVSGGNFSNLYVVDRQTNLGKIQIKSLNFTTNYTVPLGDNGTISLMNQAAVLLSFKNQAIPGQLTYEFAGTTTEGGGAQGTLPRLRMYTTADYSVGQYDFGIANTFIGAVKDIGAGGVSYYNALLAGTPGVFPGHVASFMSWDLRASWKSAKEPGAKGLTVTAGVNDLFDRLPPVSSNINPAAGASAVATAWRASNNADIGTYGTLGRLIYVQAAVKF